MQTNKTISSDSVLHEKAKNLLTAAYEYWQQYRVDVGGASAVVWLEADNGHFILFTRSEYKDAITAVANRECAGEEALFEPFGSEAL